jgi:predicted RNase H-like nuclease (RuvC/YqgF family)
MSQNRRRSKKVESEGVKQEINIPESKAPISEESCTCGQCDAVKLENSALFNEVKRLTEIIEEREGTIAAFKKEVQSKSDFIKHLENSISVKEDALNLSREKADRYSKELSKLNSFGKWLYEIDY